MPFAISGNIEEIDKTSLRKLEKQLGIILSPNQPPLQQRKMIQRGISHLGGFHQILESLSRKELLSLIFIITQFGDVCLEETPGEYANLSNIPYVLEWRRNHFMIPLEIFEILAGERLFKEQSYLFSLIPNLTKEEKTAWLRWIGSDYEKTKERSINFEIYAQCRILQKPYNGKSLIQETEFSLIDIWPVGTCEELDWYYKGLTTFYYALMELSKKEKDPFKKHIIDIIRCGKLILKKPERYLPATKSLLIATVEGATPQLRDSLFRWEMDKKESSSLFQI